MEYQHKIWTDVLELDVYTRIFNDTLAILKSHSVNTVMLMFGWAWFDADDERQWKPFEVSVDEVKGIIEKVTAEQKPETPAYRSFGEDDVYLIVEKPSLEILFCHEGDIHLEYNSEHDLFLNLRVLLQPYLRPN